MKKFFEHGGFFSILFFIFSLDIYYQGSGKHDIAYPIWGSVLLILAIFLAFLSVREMTVVDRILANGQHFTAKVLTRTGCANNRSFEFILGYTDSEGKECMTMPLNNQSFYSLEVDDLVEISVLNGNCIIVRKIDE